MICAKKPRLRRGSGSPAAMAAIALIAVLPAGGGGTAPPQQRPVAGGGPAMDRYSPAMDRYSPAYLHPYRHGVVPTVGRLAAMRSWMASGPAARTGSAANMAYGGGIDKIGVTTGPEKVYLVFYGSQWGTQGNDGKGNVTLSGDPSGEAPYLQQMLKGLGTNGESWSRVMTQYCQGSLVAIGSQTCPATVPASDYAAYPVAPALAGVWVDGQAAAPQQADGHQLAAEAVSAATHFHNTTPALNRDAMYLILSPTGTNPDGFNSGGNFCAWHDWNGDSSLTGGAVPSPDGDIAFTNLPYLTDAGPACGAGFVSGALDGVSMVAGHEFAETVTDQNPAGGWSNAAGDEVGDRCSWVKPGFPGGAADVSLATGTFAMQAIWSNAANGGKGACQLGGAFNGGFETGTFADWTAAGHVRVVSWSPHSGKYDARAGRPTAMAGNSRISQAFTAGSTRLSFWFDDHCPDAVSQSWVTAWLSDTTAGKTVRILAKTCEKSSGWKQVMHPLIAGHSYLLTLTNHDGKSTGAGSYVLFDDVSAS